MLEYWLLKIKIKRMKLLKQTCFKLGICLPIWFFIFNMLGFRTSFAGAFVIGSMSFLCIDMIMWGYKGYKE